MRNELLELARLYTEWGRDGEPFVPEETTRSVVYFIVAPVENAIKIGTSIDFPSRFKALSDRPSRLYTVALVSGSVELERSIHKLFDAERIPGTEWFRPSMRLLWFVQRVRQLGDGAKAHDDFIASKDSITTQLAEAWSRGEEPTPEAAE